MPNKRPDILGSHRGISLIVLLREIAMIVCGLTMAAIALALWVAWSKPVFAGVLITCMASMAIVVMLSRFGEDHDAGTTGTEPGKRKLGGEFLEELQRHLPLTHHHRRLSDPRIRRKMARLRDMIRRSHR